MKSKILIVIAGIVALLVASCSDSGTGSDPRKDPAIAVSKTNIDLSGSPRWDRFDLTNSGGGQLEWKIDEKPDWLDISDVSGIGVTASDTMTIRMTTRFDKLEYGTYIGQSVNEFCTKYQFKPQYIASHGHTVFHQPEIGITRQIGNGQEIAASTGINTISDFRSGDVALGGQGAPLVPIGDELLFSGYEFCLNLGGFSNISYREKEVRKAFDICPVNIILNHLCPPYDKDGTIGSQGSVHSELLNKLNNIEYYHKQPPKSLGREWLENEFMPYLEGSGIPHHDLVRTVYEHIAIQITNVLHTPNEGQVLLSGGGTHNTLLTTLLKEKSSVKIVIPDRLIIDYKEALIFAFLGVLRVRNETNCLSSVTGASRDSSGGNISFP